MNNCRAGLYSFALTSCWLREKGVASPPSLVVLGLMLPDSRMLNGIASIGLTLINIAIILPYLRQPILDSVRTATESAPAREQNIQGQTESLPEKFDATQSVSVHGESLVPTSVSQGSASLLLPSSATVGSARFPVSGSPESLDININAGPYATLLPTTADHDLTLHSPDADLSPRHSGSRSPLTREGRGALYIPLPAPDDLEIAFFDKTDDVLSDDCLEETCPVAARETACEQVFRMPCADTSKEHANSHLAVVRSGQIGRTGIDKDLTPVTTPGTRSNMIVNRIAASEQREPATEGTVNRLQGGTIACSVVERIAQKGHSSVAWKRNLSERRPESLQFIPQSVISRCPSSPTVSTSHCFGHPAIVFGHNDQNTPITPDILISNPGAPLGGTIPQASYTTLEGQWRTSPLPGPQRRTLVIQAILAQGPQMQGLTSISEYPTEYESTPPRKRPAHSRRFGVFARATLRNRRATVRRGSKYALDDSSASGNESSSDTDSQDSGGSLADEGMLPHILGTDLIAAIDSNSESELNLAGSRKPLTKYIPLDMCRDFLASDDSAADVSMMMHVSSIDGASDGEIRAPAAFRPRTYEDIQQWASGVVHNRARQVCRSRTQLEPISSPQTSDICAERPSGPGISKCPLSGLHCKLGHAISTEAPGSRTKELRAPPTSASLSSQKPLSVRNVRDVPEFVPRRRRVPVAPSWVEGPRRPGTRATVDTTTRDAATEVIARMESQAGFNARQWVVGMGERRIMNTVGGPQRTLRCA